MLLHCKVQLHLLKKYVVVDAWGVMEENVRNQFCKGKEIVLDEVADGGKTLEGTYQVDDRCRHCHVLAAQ